jgi:hypothetical protein
MNTYVQCVLESGNMRMVSWLDNREDLEIGKIVTLSDSDEPDRKWKILSMSKPHSRDNFIDSHKARKTFRSLEARQSKKDLKTR